jgi:hypothetical protein
VITKNSIRSSRAYGIGSGQEFLLSLCDRRTFGASLNSWMSHVSSP